MNLQANLKVPIRTNFSLKPFTTFKIGGSARYFAEPNTREELLSVLEFAQEKECPYFVIGRGSNLLVSDEGYEGLVLSLRQFESRQVREGKDGLLTVAAGLGLIQLNMICVERRLSGAEFLCHVPGTVGGSLVMNAGFGRPDDAWHEIKDIFESAGVMFLDGSTRALDREELQFAYRSCELPKGCIVLEVTFRLWPAKRADIDAEIKANFSYRNSVQDLRYPSAGSIFKNPRGHRFTSGQLLDQVRMKKERIGGAMISERHANFILNVDRASASDVTKLIELGQKRVFERFGVELEPEVIFIGNGKRHASKK